MDVWESFANFLHCEKLEDVVGEFDEESWASSFGAEQYKRR